MALGILVLLSVPADAKAPGPQISGFTPTEGPVGTQVAISGQDLHAASSVQFNGTDAPILSDNRTQILTSVPSGATTGPITVVTSRGSDTTSSSFTVPGPPNIVLILTDDQRFDELEMPTVQSELLQKGTEFTNAFVPTSLCCPSRTTILTGKYSHGTDIYDNQSPHGGFKTFTNLAEDQSTVATWLQSAGYYTGLIGKYLTGYNPNNATYIPPGWNEWDAFAPGNGPNGPGKGLYYNYYMSVNGTLVYHSNTDADYSTDVISGYATDFINNAPKSQPIFLYFTPRAPHLRAIPPRRYKDALPDLAPLRPPNHNEDDVSDKPAYIQALPQLDATQQAAGDDARHRQYRALLGVDDAVNGILTALQNTGRLGTTMIVFASDNGLTFAEHRWHYKEVPYEESLRVPLIVRYDPVTNQTASTDGQLVLNLDFAPTFADAAGVAVPDVEGASLLPLLSGFPTSWRSDFLTEFADVSSKGMPAYCGVRNQEYKYVKYATGEEELYDLVNDPYELDNLLVTRAGDPAVQTIRDSLYARMVQLCSPPPPGFTP